MGKDAAILVMGTFDSKGEELTFLKRRIEERGLKTITINTGTGERISFSADIDLYDELRPNENPGAGDRDRLLASMILLGRETVKKLHQKGMISGVISAGGGTGTHLCTAIMQALPMGVAKVMVSTVASRDMSTIVGTSDITMMHSVTDILGVNSITGGILDRAAAAVCAMAQSTWQAETKRKRIALSFFGFITQAANNIRQSLESMGYEIIPFHANGTGGMAMMKMASEGYFDGILDLATHELADSLMGGYCGGIGPERYEAIPGKQIPRLVVPGGMDCAVLEFTRDHIPEAYAERKIFFYDFRSAIRLSVGESTMLARQLSEKLNTDVDNVSLLIPAKGFSEADREGAPLYEPETGRAFIEALKLHLNPSIRVDEADFHINDPEFANLASSFMDELIRKDA